MFDKTQLQCEIWKLQSSIQKMHIVAWEHRVNKNRIAMKVIHRHINIAKKRISDCEWMVSELEQESKRKYKYQTFEVIFVAVMALAFVVFTR
jgi:hypothetical protein